MSELYGLTLIYVIPGVIAGTFWLWPMRRLINLWTGRDAMLTLIPKREHVHHTERLLQVTSDKV